MSMWVRLIGGLHDGEVEKIDDDQVEVVKRKNFPPPATRAMNSVFGLGSATVEVKSTRYTRRIVKAQGGEIVFFAVEGFSDFDALNHVLGP